MKRAVPAYLAVVLWVAIGTCAYWAVRRTPDSPEALDAAAQAVLPPPSSSSDVQRDPPTRRIESVPPTPHPAAAVGRSETSLELAVERAERLQMQGRRLRDRAEHLFRRGRIAPHLSKELADALREEDRADLARLAERVVQTLLDAGVRPSVLGGDAVRPLLPAYATWNAALQSAASPTSRHPEDRRRLRESRREATRHFAEQCRTFLPSVGPDGDLEERLTVLLGGFGG